MRVTNWQNVIQNNLENRDRNDLEPLLSRSVSTLSHSQVAFPSLAWGIISYQCRLTPDWKLGDTGSQSPSYLVSSMRDVKSKFYQSKRLYLNYQRQRGIPSHARRDDFNARNREASVKLKEVRRGLMTMWMVWWPFHSASQCCKPSFSSSGRSCTSIYPFKSDTSASSPAQRPSRSQARVKVR